MRRSELRLAEWADIDWTAKMIWVRRSKSEAGTNRRVPIGGVGMRLLREAQLATGRREGAIVTRSVISGKFQATCDAAWSTVPELERLTLHVGRHTYASTLLAAGYDLKRIMEWVGHADLAALQGYLKKLPQPTKASTSWPVRTTLTKGCTRRSKVSTLIPRDVAASSRVSR
jgi:integrase